MATVPTPTCVTDSPAVLGLGTSDATGLVLGSATAPVYVAGAKFISGVYGELYSTSTTALSALTSVTTIPDACCVTYASTPPYGGFTPTGITALSTGRIQITNAGIYKVTWRMCTSSSTTFNSMCLGVFNGTVNGISPTLSATLPQIPCTIATGTDQVNGRCYIRATAGAIIVLANAGGSSLTPSVTAAAGANTAVNNIVFRLITAL